MKHSRLRGFRDCGKFRRPGIEEYVKRMKGSDHVVFDDYVADIISEQGFEWNEEPRSIFEPDQLWDSLARFKHDKKMIVDSSLKAGFDLAFKVFGFRQGLPKLSPLSEQQMLKAVKLNKSSGLPLLATKSEALPYALNRLSQMRQGIKKPNPCIAFFRTQAGNKTRLVWGYPLEMTLLESIYARPLIDMFKEVPSPMAFGMAKPTLGGLLQGLCNKGKYVYGLDYSKFDSSVRAPLIHMAFTILFSWFDQEVCEGDKDKIIQYFIHTPIVMPDGHLYKGKNGGIPSGSYFTQLVGSVVNVILLGAVADRMGFDLFHHEMFVLGDDSIFATRQRLKLEDVAKILLDYGVTLNVMKTHVNELHFLGALWRQGLPDLEVTTLATKAVFPERFRVYKNKSKEPFQVLLSYASQYISGWKFVRMRDASGNATAPRNVEDGFRHFTGSDRLHFEEGPFLAYRKRVMPTVAQRMLL